MSEGYHHRSDDRYARLDEFLCDYVDGTMDPAARVAFEEYLSGNPDLASHVRALHQARSMLCRCSCQRHAPDDFNVHLRQRLAHEQGGVTPPPLLASLASRLGTFVTVASAMAMMLMVGMLVGTTFMSNAPQGTGEVAITLPSHVNQSPVNTSEGWRSKYSHARLSARGPMTTTPARADATHPAYIQAEDSLMGWMGLQRTSATP